MPSAGCYTFIPVGSYLICELIAINILKLDYDFLGFLDSNNYDRFIAGRREVWCDTESAKLIFYLDGVATTIRATVTNNTSASRYMGSENLSSDLVQ